MKFKNLKKFVCADCMVTPAIAGAGQDDQDNVFIIGACPKCKATVALDIKMVLALFYKGGSNAAN